MEDSQKEMNSLFKKEIGQQSGSFNGKRYENSIDKEIWSDLVELRKNKNIYWTLYFHAHELFILIRITVYLSKFHLIGKMNKISENPQVSTIIAKILSKKQSPTLIYDKYIEQEQTVY